METAKPAPTFLGSLRSLGDGLLASVQERLELFTVELQEEKFRLIRTFIWICLAVFSGMMAITFASLTLVYLFWETARLAVLGGLALAYTAAFAVIVIAFRRHMASQPNPFAATLHEIGRDRECIQDEN
jgi:uncharacterized membrane protein YqjE